MSLTIQIIGYFASFLVFATFYVKRIMTLRIIAVGSNVAFIWYALGADLVPIVILHGLLLPLNLYRIYELKKNINAISDPHKLDVKILEGYAEKRVVKKNDMIFQLGAISHCIYFIKEGAVKEFSPDVHWNTREFKAGDVFGLLSYFSKSGKTFFNAQATEDSVLYVVSHDRLSELCLQSPNFGFLLMGWLASRLEGHLLYEKQARLNQI